jgi:adenylate cyclase class 2
VSEIEVKVLDIDRAAIRARLLELGATLVKKGRETNRMYDFPDERLWAAGGYARVREFEGRSLLTFKRRLPGTAYKKSEELETHVEDGGEMGRILEALGLVLRRTDEKDRESYRLDRILFEIDEWPTVPPYLEIEAPTEELVEEGLRLLGIERDERVTSERLDQILERHYGREIPRDLRFPRSH